MWVWGGTWLQVKEAICETCVHIHTSVAALSERFWSELRRRFYTTPKSYLDLINLYTALLSEKREEFSVARDRLLNGLTKLEDTNIVIDKMKIDLGELQPILEEKSKVRCSAAPPGTAVLAYSDVKVANRMSRVWHGETEDGFGMRDNAQTFAACAYSPDSATILERNFAGVVKLPLALVSHPTRDSVRFTTFTSAECGASLRVAEAEVTQLRDELAY